ncbi:hypothetical protein AA106555_0094 [Neokomagataea thailandica NBRC 106555]|uniref:Diguanylate cyclase n=2 Tax=Neokomagataea TaxID=1223423 RepID=A0A4Y6V823_9PROT|nr:MULTISPECIES: diguanylate cyclase [Neokomagataea]QDH24840.1 diguanylate cyclase [Neokomagataea tanensis]GBR50113.1 hypothetical protein AA106555_0094 [Neokomagataea thailandica NBRC 106555]
MSQPILSTFPNHEQTADMLGRPHWTNETLATALLKIRSAILPRLGAAAALSYLNTLSKADMILFHGSTLSEHTPILHKTAALPQHLQQHLLSLSCITSEVRRFRSIDNAVLISETIRSQSPLVLVCWQKQPWTQQDITVLKTILANLCGLFELDALHRRVHSNTHYDIASNLLNWKGLHAEITRRCRRLDRDNKAATFMLAYIPGLDNLLAKRSLESFENALEQCVALLRNAVRPTDAISRLSGNTFGLWLDGGDRFAIAERAERMTAHGIPLLLDPPAHLSLHIGLVCREAGAAHETADTLLERATLALNTGLREGVKWRFSHEAP